MIMEKSGEKHERICILFGHEKSVFMEEFLETRLSG